MNERLASAKAHAVTLTKMLAGSAAATEAEWIVADIDAATGDPEPAVCQRCAHLHRGGVCREQVQGSDPRNGPEFCGCPVFIAIWADREADDEP